jgi:tripartite-type tricarboxylate transporter receptor subunit TctC
MVEGIDYNLVTFDGDGTLQPALIGGQVDISVIGQAAAADYVKSGQLKALAVYSNERVESMPDVPALGELNDTYKDPLESWGPFYGAFVKEGTDDAIVQILSDAFSKGAEEDKFLELCENRGLEKLGLTGDDAVAFIKGWQSMTAWALYEAGATGDRSPADFGIEKP